MLWPLLILGYVVMVTSRPPPSTAEDFLDDLTWRQLPPEMLEQPSQWISLYNNPESLGPGKIGYNRASKRALSVLSRWKPFSMGFSNLLGRYPPRSPLLTMMPELDFVSAETRGTLRPIGQPLRWGRR